MNHKNRNILCMILLSASFFKADSFCQKASFGAGISGNWAFFQHEDKSQFDSTFFKPSSSFTVGLHSFVHIPANEFFQFRINGHFGKKKITLSNKFGSPLLGSNAKVCIHHDFIFADLSLLAFYNIAKNKRRSISPLGGFFISFNQYLDLTQKSSTRNSNGQSGPIFNLEVDEQPFSVYGGVNAGVNISFSPKFMRPILELYCVFYYSPSKIFNTALTYGVDQVENNISGRYHYLSTGINILFEKKK